ncbi:MAG: HEPN/Toprim-associated domain-containing protein, partial [Candidatus Thiodiazotropha sp.]
MVSSCTLFLDDIELTGQKAFVPDFLSALFQESDRVETRSADDGEPNIEYRANRETILKRLDLMGCTKALSERRFQEWREEMIRDEESYLEEMEPDEAQHENETLRALKELAWEEWRQRVQEVLRTMYDF